MPKGIKPVIPPATARQLAARYRAGEGLLALSEELQVGRRKLAAALQCEGVEMRTTHNKRYTRRQWDEMLAAYTAGNSFESAAAIHGADPSALSKKARTRGIPTRSPADPIYAKVVADTTRFAAIEAEADAYWLGFLFTDGYVTGGTTVGLSLSHRDHSHVEKFADYMGWAHRPRVERGGPNGFDKGRTLYSRAAIWCPQVVANLASFGMVGPKTWTIRPWDGPLDLMRHFWRGCFDGDGGICVKGHQPQMSFVGNEAMVDGICDFIRSQTGIRGYRSSKPAVGKESAAAGLRLHFASWGGNLGCRAVAELLYADATVALDRKQAIAEGMRNYVGPQRFRVVTRDELLAIFKTHGSWNAAGTHYGCSHALFIHHQRRLGISREELESLLVRKRRPLDHVTREELMAIFREHGSWYAASKVLGCSDSALRVHQRRHGISRQELESLVPGRKSWQGTYRRG